MEKHHSPDDGAYLDGLKRKRSVGSGAVRSKLACDECRRRKLRCDNGHPCDGCNSRGLPCTVSSSSRPPGRPRAEILNHAGTQSHESTAAVGMIVAEEAHYHHPPITAVTPSLDSQTSYSTTLNNQTKSPNYPGRSSIGVSQTIEPSDRLYSAGFDDAVDTDIAMTQYQIPSMEYTDHLDAIGQDWESMDFMNGFWQLPPMVWTPHSLCTILILR